MTYPLVKCFFITVMSLSISPILELSNQKHAIKVLIIAIVSACSLNQFDLVSLLFFTFDPIFGKSLTKMTLLVNVDVKYTD